jgi:quinol monooxygenase YgiN
MSEKGEVDLVVVTMAFDAADRAAVEALLARYVVLARGHEGCRNIDLVTSATRPGRYLVIQKWETPDAQRAHFDSQELVALAEGCRGKLTGPAEIDLYDPISAHDLN